MPAGKRRLVRERLTETDLSEQADYIARQNPAAALRYLDAVEDALNQLAKTPESGALWDFSDPRLAGTRVRPVPGFPKYLIFYQTVADEIRVLRVIHGARNIERVFRSHR